MSTLTHALPQGIPTPGFSLFQPVALTDSGKRWTVVGLHYVDFNMALLERITPGWHYTLSQVWGVTDASRLVSTNTDQVIACEEDLTALQEVTA